VNESLAYPGVVMGRLSISVFLMPGALLALSPQLVSTSAFIVIGYGLLLMVDCAPVY